MHFRPVFSALLAALLVGCCGGCRKPALPERTPAPTTLSPDTIASVHWVGKRHLDLEADAYYVSRVWSLPETERLQNQTFDRLSTGLWRLWLGDRAAARIPAAVLRPLLEEATLAESYLEVRVATDAPPAFVLATRTSPYYSGVWETNLAIAAELLTGSPAAADPAQHGWTLQRTNPPGEIEFTRVGNWAVLSVGPAQNSLAVDIAARIRRDGVPFVSAGTNLWLEASLDPARLAAVFPAFHLPFSTLNHLALSLSGDGANVITRARLMFARPFAGSLAAWQLPLPLMHEPLTSFTAARGLQPLLSGWPLLTKLPLGHLPDQLFLWSLAGSAYQLYLAAPLPAARQCVADLGDYLMQKGNPWLAAHGYISFDRAADNNGVTWGRLPDIRPFIKFVEDGNGDAGGWLYAGLLPDQPANRVPPPAGMIQDVLRRTNLVYYDWEVTGPRLQPCLQLGQTTRLITRRPQLPLDSASAAWLAALDPRLGTSATLVTRVSPNELIFYRRSTLGLTAPELQFLAGWLESPQFP